MLGSKQYSSQLPNIWIIDSNYTIVKFKHDWYIYKVSWCGLISDVKKWKDGGGEALYSEITCTQLNELNFNPIISKGLCALIRQKAFSGH